MAPTSTKSESALSLSRRYIPPSLAIHGAKLSSKLIALIVILATVTFFFSTCLCYICIKRRRAKNRRKRREKEERENKQLKPRINGRNARFFAPGLWRDGGDINGKRGSNREKGSGWKEGLRGKVDKGVLERWNRREREYERERSGFDTKDGFEVQEIEMQKLGAGVAGVYYGTGGGNGSANAKMNVTRPERAWLRWGRK